MLRINGVRYGGDNVIVSVTYKIKGNFGDLELAATQAGTTLRLTASGLPADGRKHTVELEFLGAAPRSTLTETFKPGKVAIRVWTAPALAPTGTTGGERSLVEDTGHQDFDLR
jgi:hypothetical protein